MSYVRLHPIVICALVLLAGGCGKEPRLAPLSGKVLFNGQPLKFGTVNMQPVAGGEFTRGIIQPDGTFFMKTTNGQEGAAIGINSVRVTCFTSQKPDAGAQAAGGELSLGRSLIPQIYNNFSTSGLKVEVKPDANDPYVIELKSG